MWKLIVGNPWALVALFALGLAFGGSGAWWVQGQRLAATQARFDGFVGTVKAEGEAAKKLAEAKAAEDKRIKENSDHEYQIALAGLRADNQRLRDARAGSRIVPAAPAAPAGSRSPGLACFDRAELEQALQRFDAGISGLFDEGDTDAVGLNVARSWAASIRAGMSPDSPASARP
jgi:hypothetical protein